MCMSLIDKFICIADISSTCIDIRDSRVDFIYFYILDVDEIDFQEFSASIFV
jgi:hypothetical protein